MEEDREQYATMKLCYAAADDDVDALREILTGRADPNAGNYEGRAPLHIASAAGNDQAVKALLELRADPNVLDHCGRTPLYEAEMRGDIKVETALSLGGAKLQQERVVFMSQRGKWAIHRSNVQLGTKLSETLKSDVYRGEWMGIEVVAKFAKAAQAAEVGRLRSRTQVFTEAETVRLELLHEIQLLATLRHPDLVMFLGACLEDTPIMFITEFMPGGDLENYYMKKRKERQGVYAAPLSQQVRWNNCVARALTFLHNSDPPIVHRDLKPLNLLLTSDLQNVKVVDFGISCVKRKPPMDMTSEGRQSCKLEGGVGTWTYMAPEVVRYEDYNEKADVYSFALIMFFISSGREPFYELGDPELVLQQYVQGNEPRPQVNQCHAKLRGIISAAWAADAGQRPAAFELLHMLGEVPVGDKCCSIS